MSVNDYCFIISEHGFLYLAKKSRSKKINPDSRLIKDEEVYAMLDQVLRRNYEETGEKDICFRKSNGEVLYATIDKITAEELNKQNE